ncbi:MAG: response regulator (CheY-like receiver, AAA-type ATPase and DNA-binding domain containing protein) [Solidesulfovibrio magneticus str. Maddingley MBC34]|uniref:Response regulator (CheY-like receiver, AAA-type ATPase and DNA-binding domain containing protein) n=1 Tax=Solidesulfovibrio magneticus str. Maddingley MBC34 TaxID=1206767 RepID=K6HBF2_9BACT|nr:MAG: response regulator (CheY-like receiver, AAA-type ATPase and DNA-binding domain containing protein) [Solidesulfovibrio magneticus str. Maddingley MBC34]
MEHAGCRARLAVVDDEATVRKRLTEAFVRSGYAVETFAEAEAFLERAAKAPFDAVLLDVRLPGIDGLEALGRLKKQGADTEVILVTGHGGLETAIEAIKAGAYHFVTKPAKLAEIRNLVKGACEKVAIGRENRRLRQALREETGLESMIGASSAMREVFELIRKIAPVGCNVLVQGASGTGKALVARAIHRLSPRRDQAFVSFNCGGFTEELISSELFGYEKGAFTGAAATRLGLLESAAGGTVFLDEIGEMPPAMQVRLLHVIQERQILRVGGTRPIDLDIRIIAATNRDLKQEVAKGLFREDLYYRLNVVGIQLPRLAERQEDIPLLARHFLDKYSLLFHKAVREIGPRAMQILMGYGFPGNVRELENIVERAVALCDAETLSMADLPRDLQQMDFASVEGERLESLEEMERRHIARVLERTGRNKGLAAQILAIPRTTLWRKLKQFELE